MKLYESHIRGTFVLLVVVYIVAMLFEIQSPQAANLPQTLVDNKHRFQSLMDDNSFVDVDNASHMPDDVVHKLVLAADRSTQTGCPFNEAQKGFFKTGDRIFVSDYYLAWFDYTLNDGVEPPATWPAEGSPRAQFWSRSGTLAGLWSLNPSTQTFRYFYSPNKPVTDLQNHLCWNWPRNELIPGSNSPAGQLYWWDKYAPPLEHTIVIPASPDGSKFDLFGTVYAQTDPKMSKFSILVDGLQDSQGVHYKTKGNMTSWTLDHSIYSDIKTGKKGRILYTLEFICKPKCINVKWKFSPQTDIDVENLYINLWLAYAGQKDRACNPAGYFPLPAKVYGLTEPYHSYNYVETSSPKSRYTFPWNSLTPCSGWNCDIGIGGNSPFVSPKLIQWGQFIRTGFDPDMNPGYPRWQLTFLNVPNTGLGTQSRPINFPFDRMILNYENSDQQQGLILCRYASNPDDWFTLRASQWYQAHYSLSTSF